MADDCDCCNPDDPCISTNCTFFEDNFTATIGSRISSYPNSGTPPGTITSSAIQSSSRGNDPPCWRVDTEINSEEGQYGDLFAINMTTWSWNPSSQGAITALRFCIDEYIDSESFYTRSDSTSKDPSIECWFIVKQGGKTYGCKISSLNTKAVWRKQYKEPVVQNDFEEIYAGERPAGANVTNPSSHPNFGPTGGNIAFGWAVHPEGPDSLLDIQTEAYTFWDNLCIKVTHATPCPSGQNAVVSPPTNLSLISQSQICPGVADRYEAIVQQAISSVSGVTLVCRHTPSGGPHGWWGSFTTDPVDVTESTVSVYPKGSLINEHRYRQFMAVNYTVLSGAGCTLNCGIACAIFRKSSTVNCATWRLSKVAPLTYNYQVYGYDPGLGCGWELDRDLFRSAAVGSTILIGNSTNPPPCTPVTQATITSVTDSSGVYAGTITVSSEPAVTSQLMLASVVRSADTSDLDAYKATLDSRIAANQIPLTYDQFFSGYQVLFSWSGAIDQAGECVADTTGAGLFINSTFMPGYVNAAGSKIRIKLV